MKRADDLVILRCELLRVSKDDGRLVWPILRDAAKRPLLKMTAAIVEALKVNATAAVAVAAAAGTGLARARPCGPRATRKTGPARTPGPALISEYAGAMQQKERLR